MSIVRSARASGRLTIQTLSHGVLTGGFPNKARRGHVPPVARDRELPDRFVAREEFLPSSRCALFCPAALRRPRTAPAHRPGPSPPRCRRAKTHADDPRSVSPLCRAQTRHDLGGQRIAEPVETRAPASASSAPAAGQSLLVRVPLPTGSCRPQDLRCDRRCPDPEQKNEGRRPCATRPQQERLDGRAHEAPHFGGDRSRFQPGKARQSCGPNRRSRAAVR